MKRLICIFLTVGVLCCLAGCQKNGLPQPVFPLEEDIVVAALEQSGLSGVISEGETRSSVEGSISYTFRDQTERKGMTTAILSSFIEEKRLLQIIYILPSVSKQSSFAWEDWEQHLSLAALLYGGFENQEEIYQDFSRQEVPQDAEQGCSWDAEFPAGYCRIKYVCNSYGTENSEYFPQLFVTIYKSEAHCEKIQQKYKENAEAMETENAEAPD